jgi:hypothetical protein
MQAFRTLDSRTPTKIPSLYATVHDADQYFFKKINMIRSRFVRNTFNGTNPQGIGTAQSATRAMLTLLIAWN